MHHIQRLIEVLNALRQVIEPLRLLTFDVLSYIGLLFGLRSLLKKGRL